MAECAKEMEFKLSPASPEDPQCNGFAESFVKFLCKLLHTASVEGKDLHAELYEYLLHYRATPHTTTEKSPAEMLFGRRLQTKLPYIFESNETDEKKKTRDLHDQKKLKQKYYFDKKRMAKSKEINVGDKVLVRQKKCTTKPPFNPEPLTVKKPYVIKYIKHAIKKDGTVKVRDKRNLKKAKERPQHLCPTWEKYISHSSADYFNFDIERRFATETGLDSSEETQGEVAE